MNMKALFLNIGFSIHSFLKSVRKTVGQSE